MSVFSEQTQESVCFISLARSRDIIQAKKINIFFSVNVAFSSLDVRISSLVSQQGKAISLFPFSLLFRTEKIHSPGALARRGGARIKALATPRLRTGCGVFLSTLAKPSKG